MSSAPLRAAAVRIGGILPFWAGDGPERTSSTKLFSSSYPESIRVDGFRARQSGYSTLGDLRPVSRHDIKNVDVTLSTGRRFRESSLSIYLSLQRGGFGSLIFWLALEDQAVLSVGEISELAWLAAGKGERIGRGRAEISLEIDGMALKLESLGAVAERLHVHAAQALDLAAPATTGFIQLVHPIVYVGDVQGASTAEEIVARHASEIACIANLWPHQVDLAKPRAMAESLARDFHPFSYGVSIASSQCTVELHPRSATEMIAQRDSQSLADHHFDEMMILSFLVEVPVLQYFAMRYFDQHAAGLMERSMNFDPRRFWRAVPDVFLLSVQRLRMSRFEAKARVAARSLHALSVKQRAYMNQAVKLYQELFSIDDLEDQLDKRLDLASHHLTSNLSIAAATSTLVMGVLALLATLVVPLLDGK